MQQIWSTCNVTGKAYASEVTKIIKFIEDTMRAVSKAAVLSLIADAFHFEAYFESKKDF